MDKLDLNLASIEDLEKIPGVTRTLARRIVAERDKLGAFGSIGELKRIDGISAELLSTLRDHLVVNASSAAATRPVIGLLDPPGQFSGRYRGYRV